MTKNADKVRKKCYLDSSPASILNECEVQLYRQMGGLRDDLIIHEKALDILIELLKKEQVILNVFVPTLKQTEG